MMEMQNEIAMFMAKFSKSVNDIKEEYSKLSPEAKQAIAKDAEKFLDDFSVANVLAHLFGQAQK